MAIEARNINPVDLKRSTGVGVGIPFSGLAVFNTTYTTQEATKINLINFLFTAAGERVLNPTLGGSIQSLLFEALSEKNLEAFKALLGEQIKKNFPDISTESIELTSNPDLNTLHITISYIIPRYATSDEITLEFN